MNKIYRISDWKMENGSASETPKAFGAVHPVCASRICWRKERAGRAKDKVALARRLRQETNMTLNWIAE
jgi:hypothetical protein